MLVRGAHIDGGFAFLAAIAARCRWMIVGRVTVVTVVVIVLMVMIAPRDFRQERQGRSCCCCCCHLRRRLLQQTKDVRMGLQQLLQFRFGPNLLLQRLAIDQTDFVARVQAALFALAQHGGLIDGGAIAAAVFQVHGQRHVGWIVVMVAINGHQGRIQATVNFAVAIGNHAKGPFLAGQQFLMVARIIIIIAAAAGAVAARLNGGNVALAAASECVFVENVRGF